MSNRLANPNFRRSAGVLSATLITSVGGFACARAEAPVSSPVSSPTSVEVPTTTLSEEAKAKLQEATKARQAADEYVKSEKRNQRINSLVQTTGEKLIQLCQSGTVGKCELGTDTTTPLGRVREAGWQLLRNDPNNTAHTPFAASVWVNEHGTIIPEEGIKSLSITTLEGVFKFTAPGGDPAQGLASIGNDRSWEASIQLQGERTATAAAEANIHNTPLEKLQEIDEKTIFQVEAFHQAL